ncbi:transcriptional regulator FtrA [Thalassotalea euphylliae]|uniref:transcriptional regulator FtrA n=1 Tax=Thalassotalea euphylliae TaxID=1655234 RepID=UPI0036450557
MSLATLPHKVNANEDIHIGVLIYNNLCLFEFSCVAEIFGLARPEIEGNWYQYSTISVDGQCVNTQYGGQMSADYALSDWREFDTIIIPGWSGIDKEPPPVLCQTLRQASSAGIRLASICSGVFVLAAAGLLEDKRATTHWRYATKLKEKYPQIHVDADVLYIELENITTSAGSAAGIDMCLSLVRQDFGHEAANKVARRLVVQPVRSGGQAQFIEQPMPQTGRNNMSEVLYFMEQHFAEKVTIAQLAGQLHMSDRTFLRHFKKATGTTPGEWLIHLRIEAAKHLLESTALSMDAVAEQVGLGTSMTLRHHFKQRVSISPMAYRKQFNAIASE